MRGNPFLLLIICTIPILIPFFINAESNIGLIINEVLPDASGSDSGKEWIELYNYSSTELNLNGYYFKVESVAGSSKTINIPQIKISPNTYFVIAEFDLGISNSLNIGSGKLGMYNTASKISLFNPSNEKIDELNYSTPSENSTFEKRGAMCTEVFQNTLGGSRGVQNTNHDSACFTEILTPPISFPEFEVQPPQVPEYKLQISEIYPSPNSGEEEWLEIYNFGDQPFNLVNLTLQKPSTSTKTTLQGTIAAQTHKIISADELKFALNNSGDEIMLFNANLKLDSIKYKSVSKGLSVGKIFNEQKYNDVEYAQATQYPTPSEVNVFPDNTIYTVNSILELKSQQQNKIYRFEGYVSLDSSLVKDNSIYITDGVSGIRVRNKSLGEYVSGNKLRIEGKLIKTEAETYIEETLIELLINSKEVKFNELNNTDDLQKFMLMNVSFIGEVINNYSTSFDVNFAGTTIRVNKQSGVSISKGNKYKLQGLLYKDAALNRLIAVNIEDFSNSSEQSSSASSKKSSLLDGITLTTQSIAEQKAIDTKIKYLESRAVLGSNSSAPSESNSLSITFIAILLTVILSLTFIDIKYVNLWKAKLIFWIKNIRLQSLKDYF